jgi:hypothetical protein
VRAAERIEEVEDEGDKAMGELRMDEAGLNIFDERDRSKGLGRPPLELLRSSRRTSTLGEELRRRLRRAPNMEEGTP